MSWFCVILHCGPHRVSHPLILIKIIIIFTVWDTSFILIYRCKFFWTLTLCTRSNDGIVDLVVLFCQGNDAIVNLQWFLFRVCLLFFTIITKLRIKVIWKWFVYKLYSITFKMVPNFLCFLPLNYFLSFDKKCSIKK